MPGRRPTNWPKAAAELARRIPRDRLHPDVRAWADSSPARSTWGIGFSGGADSLALVLLLWAHWPGRRQRLRPLHFNHRLRAAAQADADFCLRVCSALGVGLVTGTWDDRPPRPSEARARAARIAFFNRYARIVWLGHQMNDIAETQFMRLARGSGTAGLAAPRPVHELPRGHRRLRPLLTLPHAEIVAALQAVGAKWREDASNREPLYFRNRIRRRVIPAWQAAAQRDAVAGAARSRMLFEEDDDALASWLEQLRPIGTRGHLQIRRLAGKPRALLRRALHAWLLTLPATAGRLSSRGFESLLDAVATGRPTRHSLGPAGFAVLQRGSLRFEHAPVSRRRFPRGAN
jgi:tRNA(Ile)-lysidine synthase